MQASFHSQPRLIGQATGMATFGQNLGATLGLAVAEAAFSSQLATNLLTYAPGVDAKLITESPTEIYTAVPQAELAAVIRAYCRSLDIVFVLGVPFSLLALGLAFAIKNARLDAKPAQVGGGEETREEDEKESGDLEKASVHT